MTWKGRRGALNGEDMNRVTPITGCATVLARPAARAYRIATTPMGRL
jgi:hypothetical protein